MNLEFLDDNTIRNP